MPDTSGAHLRPVFVISSGRSGSTLVQRLLNCHRELVVWGEHFGFLETAAGALAQMHNPEQKHYPLNPGSNRGLARLQHGLSDPAAPLEWVNPWSAEEYAQQLRSFTEGYFAARVPAGRRWGFKEIRYNGMGPLRGLMLLYPHGRFVFVQRDIVEVTRSKVYAFVKESNWNQLSPAQQRHRLRGMLVEVQRHYQVYDRFMRRYPGVGLRLDYESLLVAPGSEIARVLTHLELDPAAFDDVLAAQVMASTITSTRRDEALLSMIREVLAQMPS